jgi:hypothetical protein
MLLQELELVNGLYPNAPPDGICSGIFLIVIILFVILMLLLLEMVLSQEHQLGCCLCPERRLTQVGSEDVLHIALPLVVGLKLMLQAHTIGHL